MLKLAKLLHFRGFHITFVNSEFNHTRLLKSRGLTSLDGFPDFQFETIPDGLPPPTDFNATQPIPFLCESTSKNCLLPFQNLLARLNDSASNGLIPPVTCLVSDGIMTFTVEAAQNLGLPILIFWTASACSYLAAAHFRKLFEKGLIPLKESQKPKSVFYVNFGSITVMSPQQLYEFAWGLANSKKTFLWIIRPDLVDGGSVILSPEFHNETKDRGFITSWCDQEKVLNHHSIGGFLTHCGWNSLTESVCAGVPMACWPFRGDQPINCRYACTKWEIGIEIDNDVKREEVEKLVIELMEGDKGKKMREKALELKKMAEEDTRPGGSSYNNLERVIKDVLLKEH
ncbi:7-deoxyloganetin glucosyltransferase-like [Senna tora]|uniref:7-deoxyloganetin glucosyltransferase-like n=1 Tax=Senna tora TaxID=362788 RepID=A0A834VZA4_9FABA|nr:7-deoxyloganetin glucosyltransferase-like [Senna tora]